MNTRHPGIKPVRLMIALAGAGLLLMHGPAESRGGFGGFGGGFGGAHFGGGGFGDRAGGGAFGGGGFGGGDAQRFGGGGVGEGHFGGGGLGSVKGSGADSGVSRDWSDHGADARQDSGARTDATGTDREQMQQNRFQQQDSLQQNRDKELNHLQNQNEVYNHYNNNYYGGYYGGGMYYGGSWGGFYSGMMMGEMTGMMLGASMSTLPRQYTTVVVEGTPYYYANGAYLTQTQGASGYTLVPPPPGAVVTSLPSNCSPVYLGPQTFNDCGGAFYQNVDGGYKVVRPPTGIQINSIPSGAVAKQVNNTQYFEYGGVWYQPFYGGSDVIYRVVANPDDCEGCGI